MREPIHHKEERVTELIKHLAAEYIGREKTEYLITVTDAMIFDKFEKATIFVTVLPSSKEAAALNFLQAQGRDMRAYIKERARIGKIPFLSFAIDKGEKNRQRIDELSIEET